MSASPPGRLLHRLGLVLSWWGLDRLALPALRSAVARNAGLLEAQFALGEVLVRRRAWGEAREALREVVLHVPSHAEALGNLALACAHLGAVERAVWALERLAAVGPPGPEPLLLAAALLKKQRRSGDAIAAFRRAAEVGPSVRTVRFFLGEEILGLREWEALVAGHRELHQATPSPPRVRTHTAVAPSNVPRRRPLPAAVSRPLAVVARRVGMWLIEMYHLANGRTQLLLGRLLSSQRRPHEAIRAFQQASFVRQQRLAPSLAWATRRRAR
jgi:tetratricopeptide (TPR) repeat protein